MYTKYNPQLDSMKFVKKTSGDRLMTSGTDSQLKFAKMAKNKAC